MQRKFHFQNELQTKGWMMDLDVTFGLEKLEKNHLANVTAFGTKL